MCKHYFNEITIFFFHKCKCSITTTLAILHNFPWLYANTYSIYDFITIFLGCFVCSCNDFFKFDKINIESLKLMTAYRIVLLTVVELIFMNFILNQVYNTLLKRNDIIIP